jgi:hypothetical protein
MDIFTAGNSPTWDITLIGLTIRPFGSLSRPFTFDFVVTNQKRANNRGPLRDSRECRLSRNPPFLYQRNPFHQT